MKTLVLVEHEGGQLKDATLSAVTAASKTSSAPAGGRVAPLTLRTYWRAAASTSASSRARRTSTPFSAKRLGA